MNQLKPISILHVVLIMMTFIGLKNHVTILPAVLVTVGRDGWMSVIIGMFLIFPYFAIFMFIQKKSKQQRLDHWLKKQYGTRLGNIINYNFAAFLFLMAAFTLREALLWINTVFLPQTPMAILLLFFSIVVILFICTSLETIVIFNVFVLFGVVVLGFLVAFINIPVKDYVLLLPMLEHGITPVLLGVFYPMSGFIELFLLLFLQHRFKEQLKWRHITIMLFILGGLTLGPLIGAITEFGPIEAAKQRYPAYEEWGLATIGRFIEHLDFFSFYQWMTGAFIRVGILLYIVTLFFNIEGQRKEIWRYLAFPFFALCLAISLLQESTFLDFHERYFLLITLGVITLYSLIIAAASFFNKKRVTEPNEG